MIVVFTLNWPDKHVNEDLPYKIDWTEPMENQTTIELSEWVVPTGLTSHGEAINDKTTVIWLSGGTAGTTYIISNTITTNGLWKDRQDVRIRVRA